MKAKQKSNNILFTMIKNLFSCKSRPVSIQIFLLYSNFNFISQNTIESKPKNNIKKINTVNTKEITPKTLKELINNIKMTKFSTSFILPKEWLHNFMNSDDKNDKNKISIKNEVFLNTKKNNLKKKLDFEKIVIVVYEIMENIIYLEYEIDYLIMLNYDSKNNSYDFEDILVAEPSVFYKIDPFYEQIKIDKGYFEPLNTKYKNNISESTNELLNSKEDNKKEPKIKITKSGKIKNISANEESEDNNKLKGKKNYINKKEARNESKNTIDEENIEELKSNEKINNTNYNSNNSKSKELDNDIILINKNNVPKNNNYIKENENDNKQMNKINIKETEEEINENNEFKEKIEENKIYFFNEKEMIINLSNFKGEPIKPVGLINPSIYCFMISILQSLISIPELNYFFLSKIYLISSFHNNTNNNDNKSIDENELKNEYPICTSYQFFIKRYLLSKKNYIQIPRNILLICNKLLGGMRMHDSQEFFVCFLEALQEEINSLNKNKKEEKKEKNEEKNEKNENSEKMEEKWIKYRKKNNSFIDSLFTGLMRSTVECKNCKHRSITYDPFIDLNLSINKYKNLEKCLKQYFENEKIDCEYKCDNCKQISKVSILIFIFKLNIFFHIN